IFGHLYDIVQLILRSLIIWLVKTLKVFTAVLLAVLKQVSAVILTLLQPVLWIIRFFKPEYRHSAFVVKFSKNTGVNSIEFINEIWQNYLVFNAVEAVYTDFRKLKNSFKHKQTIVFLLKLLLAPFQLFYYLVKFLMHALFEIIFRIVHGLIILAGLLIYAFVLVFRLILTPITKSVVFVFDKGYGFIDNAYPRIVQKSLDNKFVLLGTVIVLFLFCIYVIVPRLGSELIPEVHQGEFYVDITLPIGTPVEKTDERVLPIAEAIKKLPGINKVAMSSGTDKTATTDTDKGEHTSRITVTLDAKRDLEDAEIKAISAIRNKLDEFSGIQSNIARPAIFSFKTPIEVHIKGYNLAALQRLSRQMETIMSEIPGVEDAKASLQRGNPEVQIFYNRRLLARYGLNVLSVAALVRNKVRGDVATEFKDEDRKIDILVRLRDEDKQSIDDLRRLIINPGSPRPIPLSSVADIRVNEGPSEIRRIDQQRTTVITANVAPGADLKTVSDKIYEAINRLNIPNDFSFEIAGQNKEMETSLNSLMLALGLAIFLVYIVMASQFESLIHPFVIIFTIPLALIGVFLFLYILDIPLSIVVFLGMIMLAGIVVNNAIVLVDYINHLRSTGMEKVQAIIQGGRVRLRPILMTTATTVLGLLPMAIGMGDGAEIRTPMAITVIVGLITSTILTLVVIPTVYALVDRKE
ncbi:MAG: efflux RND transporter permease subunit, partial [Calditrichaceae bacterium]